MDQGQSRGQRPQCNRWGLGLQNLDRRTLVNLRTVRVWVQLSHLGARGETQYKCAVELLTELREFQLQDKAPSWVFS